MLMKFALRLARETGALGANENEGYNSATVRVSDPLCRPGRCEDPDRCGVQYVRLFTQSNSYATVSDLNSAFGLLGGISLLVASFGIAIR